MPRLTDVHLEIGLDDEDEDKFDLTLSGNVRDDEDTIISQYRRGISDELNQGSRQALGQILKRVVDRLLRDQNLTRDDLASGKAAHEARKAAGEAEGIIRRQEREAFDAAEAAKAAALLAEGQARLDAIVAEEEQLRGPAEELAERLRQESEAAAGPPAPEGAPA